MQASWTAITCQNVCLWKFYRSHKTFQRPWYVDVVFKVFEKNPKKGDAVIGTGQNDFFQSMGTLFLYINNAFDKILRNFSGKLLSLYDTNTGDIVGTYEVFTQISRIFSYKNIVQ